MVNDMVTILIFIILFVVIVTFGAVLVYLYIKALAKLLDWIDKN